MERSRPLHGGYPGDTGIPDAPRAPNPLLGILPAEQWYAIEKAARCENDEQAEFYRAKAGYTFKSLL